ncbi:hypothetical protein [Streptomyces rishiriensis]|uniref:hypothetical protein n=1 Tax=Streptomyces rishiriensis TaxID=68264 RepID=UPI000D598862|nr:hypothetical protein [Streptomyces rishiriensis]
MTDAFLLGSLCGVIALRLAVIVSYCWRTDKPFTSSHVKVLQYSGQTNTEKKKRHEEFFETTTRQFNTLLIAGSISLAAWSQLFTNSTNGAGQQLTSLTRNLLLLSSVVLLSAPLIFRRPAKEFQFICRESLTAVGLALLILSLASALADLFCDIGFVVSPLIAVAVFVADLEESVRVFKMY